MLSPCIFIVFVHRLSKVVIEFFLSLLSVNYDRPLYLCVFETFFLPLLDLDSRCSSTLKVSLKGEENIKLER